MPCGNRVSNASSQQEYSRAPHWISHYLNWTNPYPVIGSGCAIVHRNQQHICVSSVGARSQHSIISGTLSLFQNMSARLKPKIACVVWTATTRPWVRLWALQDNPSHSDQRLTFWARPARACQGEACQRQDMPEPCQLGTGSSPGPCRLRQSGGLAALGWPEPCQTKVGQGRPRWGRQRIMSLPQRRSHVSCMLDASLGDESWLTYRWLAASLRCERESQRHTTVGA